MEHPHLEEELCRTPTSGNHVSFCLYPHPIRPAALFVLTREVKTVAFRQIASALPRTTYLPGSSFPEVLNWWKCNIIFILSVLGDTHRGSVSTAFGGRKSGPGGVRFVCWEPFLKPIVSQECDVCIRASIVTVNQCYAPSHWHESYMHTRGNIFNGALWIRLNMNGTMINWTVATFGGCLYRMVVVWWYHFRSDQSCFVCVFCQILNHYFH